MARPDTAGGIGIALLVVACAAADVVLGAPNESTTLINAVFKLLLVEEVLNSTFLVLNPPIQKVFFFITIIF